MDHDQRRLRARRNAFANTMTPEAQRIAIVEACPNIIGLSSSGAWMFKDANGDWKACLNNDPLQDLNAMHEAEKVLNEEQQYKYVALLVEKDWSESWAYTDVAKAITALAVQRAEAFRITLELFGKEQNTEGGESKMADQTSPAAQQPTRPVPGPHPRPTPRPRPVPSHEKFDKMREVFQGDDEMQKFIEAMKRLFWHKD